MQGFPAPPHPAAGCRLKSSRARRYLRCLVRCRSSAEDLEDRPAKTEVQQAYVGDHKQHKDQYDDEIVDQLRAGRIDNLAQFADRLPDELKRRRTLSLDRLISLLRSCAFRRPGGTACFWSFRAAARG